MFHLTQELLLDDICNAYHDARKHKRNKGYQLGFEAYAESNLLELCDELFSHSYTPRPSSCFLITDPKLREVFAADFRDRIVHHLYFNYVHGMLERTFIQDSYSCIKGRGTHYGIARLQQHILKESQNYREKCWVLKLDIRGYFMHINRERLLDMTLKSIEGMAHHRIDSFSNEKWCDILDMDFVRYLTREIVLLNPTSDCRIHGDIADWSKLPPSKSLFHSPEGCGLPIGNLTSQLFSNVYLNELDQYMKRTLHCRHYGRYVDDFFVVSCDREWLKSLIPKVMTFLMDRLGLSLQEGKVGIHDVRYGVEFLGAYLKPHRTYVSNTTLRRVNRKITALEQTMSNPDMNHLRCSLSSILGLMRHYKSWNLRKRLVEERLWLFEGYGRFDSGLSKFIPYEGFGNSGVFVVYRPLTRE